MSAPARWKVLFDELTGIVFVLVGVWLLLVGNALGLVVTLAGRELLFHPAETRSRLNVLSDLLHHRGRNRS